MDKLNTELLKRIEKVLNLEFREWQVNYLLDISMVLDMHITGRGTGKTLVYIIKLLFEKDKPILIYDMSEIVNYCDWFSVSNKEKEVCIDSHYTRWFRNYLFDIYKALTSSGIVTRPIIFNKQDDVKNNRDEYKKHWIPPNFKF